MTDERVDLGEKPRRFSPPRFLLLACVVAGTIWAFNLHFENMATRMASVEEIRDETGSLPPERLKLLKDASRAMRETYGVGLRVVVRHGPVPPPRPDAATLFIGLDTSSGTATVLMPALLARALPEGLAASLQSGYFEPYLAAGTWPEGLYSCVLAILEALDGKR